MDNPEKEGKQQDGSFPFSSFLQTDYIPNTDEGARIKQFLQESEAQFKHTDEKLDRLYADIEAAEREHTRLQSDIERYSSIISRARTIPDSILRAIFCCCLPADRNAVLNINTAPLLLTRVSSHWRNIAFTTPPLWSKIHVPVVLENMLDTESTGNSSTVDQAFQRAVGRAKMVSQWLHRSGETPLNISLFIPSERDYWSQHYRSNRRPPRELIDEYIKAIKPFSMRWKSIRLAGGHGAYQNLTLLSEKDVPLLESLCLELEETHYESQIPVEELWLNSGLFITPSLRRLSISDQHLDIVQTASANMKALTHLSLGYPRSQWDSRNHSLSRLTQMSRILRDCTALVHLSIYLESMSWEDDFKIPEIFPVHIPSLRRLALKGRYIMLPLIEKFKVPALEEIVFESAEAEDAEAVILKLVAEANGNLRKLSLKTDTLNDSAFRDILRQSPKLTSLVLMQVPGHYSPQVRIDDELLDHFAPSDGPCLCPLLEEFTCEFESAFTYDGFLNFVKRKQSGLGGRVAKLKKVSIHAIFGRDPATRRNKYRYFSSALGWEPFKEEGIIFNETVIHEHDHNVPRRYTSFSAREGWLADDEDD